MEMMFTSAQTFGTKTSSNICIHIVATKGTGLILQRYPQLRRAEIFEFTDSNSDVVENNALAVPQIVARSKALSWYLGHKHKRHTVVLDTDVLVVNSFERVFQYEWDVALSNTNVGHALINNGVVLVHRDGHKAGQLLFNEFHNEQMRISSSTSCASGCLDEQAAVEWTVNNYSRTVIIPQTRLKPEFRCRYLQGLPNSTGVVSVLLLPWTEYNEIPSRAGRHTSFVHFKGPRKSLMHTWFTQLMAEGFSAKMALLKDAKRKGGGRVKRATPQSC